MLPTTSLLIAISDIVANPYQPRTLFDEAELTELADSIRAHGIIQPLVIVENTDPDTAHYPYRLVDGERRLRAAQIAGLTEVPVVFREAAQDAQTEIEIAMIANIQRADLSPADEARAYQRLHDECGLTDEQIGRRVGKSRSTITNARRLAELPAEVLSIVGEGEDRLPVRYARSLVSVARIDAAQAIEIAQEVAQCDDEEREDEFGDGVRDILKANGVDLRNAIFELKWAPGKTEYELDGVLQTLPACTSCESHIKHDYEEWCAKPDCYKLKRSIWIDKELKRISKASGIAIAEKGEKTHPLPKKAGNWHHVDTWKKMAATKHESLRLVFAGDASTGKWEASQVSGSECVRVVTTDPEALAKAVGIKTEAEAAKSKDAKPEKTWAEQQAERKERREVAEAAIAESFKVIAPAFAKVLPDNRALMWHLLQMTEQNDTTMPDDLWDRVNVSAKQPRPSLPDLKLAYAYILLNSQFNLSYDKPRAIEARDPIDELARDLKVKLPTGWDDALKLKPAKSAAKKPAKK